MPQGRSSSLLGILTAASIILAKPAPFLSLIFITPDKPREKATHLAFRLAQKVSKQIAWDEKKWVLDEPFSRTRACSPRNSSVCHQKKDDFFKTKESTGGLGQPEFLGELLSASEFTMKKKKKKGSSFSQGSTFLGRQRWLRQCRWSPVSRAMLGCAGVPRPRPRPGRGSRC